MAERVLITGGAGFIGSHTADRLLERGFDVRVLDTMHPQVHPGGVPRHLSPDVELVRADVRDLDAVTGALAGVTRVLHLAAETSVGQSLFEADHHVDVNARGTAVLFRAIRETAAPVSTVVISSSRAVYGEGRHRCVACDDERNPGPRRLDDLLAGRWRHRCPRCGDELVALATDEQTERRSASVYGLTKSFQEQLGELESAQLGIPVVALRYFNVYGPRQSPDNPYTGLINTLALRLLGGQPIVLYEDGTPLRDFVHVDDVVAANLRALDLAPGGAINVGTGRAVSLVELAAALSAAFGIEARVERSARFRLGDIHAAVADVTQAHERLGLTAEVPLEAGLLSVVEALRDQDLSDRSDDVERELRTRGVLHG